MKLKILLVQHCYPGFGGYYRTICMAKALAKKVHQVEALFSSKKNSIKITKTKEGKNLNIYLLPRINIHRLVNGKILRGLVACFFILFKKYDIIHIFESVMLETNIPLALSKVLNKKVILDTDEDWTDCLFSQQSGKLINFYLNFCDLKFAPKFDFMTMTSDYLAKKYQKLGVKHAFRIINGVDYDQFTPVLKSEARKYLKIAPSDKVMLSFGNTYMGDRAYLLLKTYQEVYKRDKSVRLYFTAPQPFLDHPKIKKEIEPEVIKKVIITGYISSKDLPYYLAAADLTLFLTKDTKGERACYPARIGTFLNGERVIAITKTKTEVYRSLKPFNCVLCGSTPEEVAQLIIKFFQDKKFRQRLERNVLRAKKELGWDNLIIKLLKFYELRLEN